MAPKELIYTTVGDAVLAHRNLPPGGRHLMVAVDLSEHSFEAVSFAFDSIAREGDVVSVVQAIPPIEGQFGRIETPGEKRQDAMVSLHEKVRGIRNGLGRKNIPFRTDVEYGDARKVVLELVEASQATILIVGSRGRTSLKGALLGSVSQYLLTNAPIPVIVVRHPKGQTPK
ncbi:hypothetical protein HK105_208027 [Polyrhizophydium stewartii]|uniref:UspA domain-containing protein n=1 Tax=Polyrhizophydium stewartii TaxID=2732419 RepID=A0ABR4MYU9_9FUNG